MDMELILDLTPKKEKTPQLDSSFICTMLKIRCLHFEKPVELTFFIDNFVCHDTKIKYENVVRLFSLQHANKSQVYFVVIEKYKILLKIYFF